MAYRVKFSPDSDEDLGTLRAYDQRRIISKVRSQLTIRPNTESRNQKCLGDHLSADFEYVPPLWELRIGEFRVFYELDEGEELVYVLAVRRKPTNRTTAEVLNEKDND